MKILYVEDNPANVFLVKRVARMGNHEIINYIDGDKALEKYNEIDPDLVLMDIQLAGNKNGLDVVKSLRGQGVKTPIIAVTAYAMVGDKERCIEAGCDDYLAKPLPIQRLVEMFKSYSEETAKAKESVAATPEKTPEPETLAQQTETESTTVSEQANTVSIATSEKSETTNTEPASTASSDNTEASSTGTSEQAEPINIVSSDNTEAINTASSDNTEPINTASSDNTEPVAEEVKEEDSPKSLAELDKSTTIESTSDEKVTAAVSEIKAETEPSSVVENTPVAPSAESDVTEKMDSAGELSAGEKNL